MIKIKTKIINIPLSSFAKSWLPEKGTNKYIFTLPNDITTIERCLRKWANDSGINKYITYHVSRHTCATELLYLGADLYTVSKILGHSNIATTQIYAHIADKQKIAAIELFDKKFNN